MANVTQANAASLWKAALTNKEILKRDKEEKDERRRMRKEYSSGIPKENKPKLEKTYSSEDKLVESLQTMLQRFMLKKILKEF